MEHLKIQKYFWEKKGLPKKKSYPDFINWIKEISLDWDIGLILLLTNNISKYKSNIKFLEYAMLGIPIIVSESNLYKNIAVHEKTVLS